MHGERDRDGASAGADVENLKRMNGCGFFCDEVEDGFDEELGFGARDEGIRRDAEGDAEEFLLAGEMLQWFVGGAAGGENTELSEVFGGEWVVGMGEKPSAVSVEDVREESFGIACGDVGRGFGDGFAESHKGRQ